MVTFVIIVMIIWLLVLQIKLNELSVGVKNLTETLSNKVKAEDNKMITGSEVVPEEPKKVMSISDIPDEEVFDFDTVLPEQNSGVAEDCKAIPVDSSQLEDGCLSQDNTDLDDVFSSQLGEEHTEKKSFEKIFLGNIFNKIGALAILICVIIFIKIISPFIVFTPEMKIASGFLAGIVMALGALKLHKKENMKNYAEVLLGTGFGTMFITTYCANVLFHIFNLPVTFVVATGLLVATFYLADRLKTISMLGISLIAGYLNPFFITGNLNIPNSTLFGYLLFINLLSIVYTYRNKSRSCVNMVNLIMTCLVVMIFGRDLDKLNALFPGILWAMYFVYDLILGVSSEEIKNKATNYTNYVVFTLFTIFMNFTFKSDFTAFAAAQGVVGVFYILAAYIRRDKTETCSQYVRLFLTTTIVAFCSINSVLRPYIWSIEALIISYLAAKYKHTELSRWGAGILLVTFAAATQEVHGVLSAQSIDVYRPIFNLRLLAFAPVFMSSVISARLLAKTGIEKLAMVAKTIQFAYISVAYLYVACEAYDIINKYLVFENISKEFFRNMLYTIMGFVYTIQLKKLHNDTNTMLFGVAAAVVGTAALLHLICNGMSFEPLAAYIPVVNIRCSAFLMAVLTAVMYAKWKNCDVFKYIAIALGFVLMHVELADLVNQDNFVNTEYLISIGWVLYAGIVTAVGIFKEKNFLKLSGIVLCILSIARIFIYDLANVDIMYKFFAFLILGIVLMVLSYIYNKRQK